MSLVNSKETSSTLLSINEITTAVEPSPSCQSKNFTLEELLSSWEIIIVAGFLLFTNIITVILLFLSCLCLLRSRRKHVKM